MTAATEEAARVDEEAERRRRTRELLDATTPGRSIAVRRCKLALETFRTDGSLREARTLLRDALDCSNVQPHHLPRLDLHGGADRHRRRRHQEALRGLALLVPPTQRQMPRNREPEGRGRLLVPLYRLRAAPRERRERAGRRAVLLSALDAFAADAKAREWLQKEVARYSDSMRHRSWRRLLRGLLPFCRRWSRPAQGYQLLALA
ncbi:hypothetical protein BAE44_0018280 [Dichanthelium oligosanthes]|uniref:Uncharacterized protein n=1 Tax=Dichanthelium oligosanthes TaxID=888268 RepID=A0A1E5V6F6_9POAL|nr:hypothetical protein BAE44_0018280 [Dichanthelium oligosanthes]